MKKKLYTQCLLKRGKVVKTTWIPSTFAIIGNVLKLREDNADWSDGWEVAKLYAQADHVPHFALIRRTHRGRTGDSEPKQKG